LGRVMPEGCQVSDVSEDKSHVEFTCQ
jgi:hypothetical protein